MRRTCCLTFALVLVSTTIIQALPTLPVQSFDFATLQQDHHVLLDALKAIGIVAIKNVPRYATTRKQCLTAAMHCVNSPAAKQSGRLGFRTLNDGTQRTTISTKARVGHPAVSAPQVDCANYTSKLRDFSAVVDTAAVALANALDLSVEEGKDSLTDIVLTANHLDHLHQYVSPNMSFTDRTDGEDDQGDDQDDQDNNDGLSLSLHTDGGIAILMTVPQFNELDDGEEVAKDDIVAGPAASAGLVIQLPDSDDTVQPLLHEDELIVMVGDGMKAWTNTGLDINPVLHGMQMPRFDDKHGQVARLWYGKMLLMPEDRVMKNTGMAFGAYTNATTDYVTQERRLLDADFSSVACPPHTRLVATDQACALKQCQATKTSGASNGDCMKWCNAGGDTDQCAGSCECGGSAKDKGLHCWMQCMSASCAPGKQRVCAVSGVEATVCQ
ncbi:TPA: hypothetical protein N0F65_000798 [Lagenidium giganteum]|uniref:Uncharacterized protein n=1 Tax=Lagenidium giganteum TaxID=4803 RepID=A0AAV2ZHT1_9STRA|nr:TPA: hypothetical protein N0F65_000798 [Lagenidium giganteum]